MTTHTITRLGHQGDGIADGPVFAPATLPGETVTGTLKGDQLHDVKIVSPSDARVRPPCPHARSCGGCQLQHASDAFVADWKRQVVETALAAQGIDAPILGPITSPAASRRRATLSVRRGKKSAQVGFHAKASDLIVPIPNCHLLDPKLMAALPVLQDLARLLASRKGEMAVQLTTSANGLDVDIRGGKHPDAPTQTTLATLATSANIARLSMEGETLFTLAPATQSFDGIQVTPPPGAFLQATQHGETALRHAVHQALGQPRHVIDLFAGCGTFALPLTRTAQVHAVEGNKDMTQALATAWRQAGGLRPLTHDTRDLFKNPVLASDLTRFDAAVIDPPRAGAEAQVAELAQSGIGRIAHVSCNPVTFARDTATLQRAGYRLSDVTVVDQFRWSTHIEMVGTLIRD